MPRVPARAILQLELAIAVGAVDEVLALHVEPDAGMAQRACEIGRGINQRTIKIKHN